jgi:hypothetical protein
MQPIMQWFQDWSDACEYARECAPDLSFFTLREPYSALLSIALGAALLWLLNEPRAKAVHKIAQTLDDAAYSAPTRSVAASPRSAPAHTQKAA